jgi:hypothetical protein
MLGWGSNKRLYFSESRKPGKSEIPGVSLGILVSTYSDMMDAFADNDAFQKAAAGGRHIVGQAHLVQSK